MKLLTPARIVVLALSALTAVAPAGANPTAPMPHASSLTTAPVASSPPITAASSAAALNEKGTNVPFLLFHRPKQDDCVAAHVGDYNSRTHRLRKLIGLP